MTTPRDSLAIALAATRRRLLLVTLLLIAGLVIAMGIASGVAGLRALDADVDRALAASADSAVASLDGELPASEEPGDSEERPAASDTFVLYLNAAGALVADPSRVRLDSLPDPAAVAAARETGRDLRTVTAGGIRVRLLTAPIRQTAAGGEPIGYVQAGFVLTLHDAQSASLVTAIALVGLLGLAGAAAVTLLVTGRALVPIRRAFSSQRRFLADASHELRTPAALIRSTAEVLERERLIRPEGRRLVADINAEADRLGRLVDDLLALASADATVNAVFVRERRPVDLEALADDSARRAEAFAATRSVTLVVEPRVPAVVAGDADRLLQLLLILLDNAIAHSPAGRSVRIGMSRADGHVAVSVDDEGPGIAAADRDRVFEPFARVAAGDSVDHRGTGLGLAIGRRIALAHDGAIRAEPSQSGGARFVITLPLAPRGRAA